MNVNVEPKFQDVKGGDRAEFIKWMRTFYSRWYELAVALNIPNYPFLSNLFTCMAMILNEGEQGYARLDPAVRSDLYGKIMSFDDLIVAIEENSGLILDFFEKKGKVAAGYAVLYLSGRELPDSDLTASQHEVYAGVKAMIDADQRANKFGKERRDSDKLKVTIHPASALDPAVLKLFALLGDKERQLEASSQAFDQAVVGFNGQLVDFKDQWNRDFSLVKEAYDKNMALQAPVKYWDLKREKHQRWVIGTGFIVLILMVFSVWFLSYQVKSVKQGYVVQAANAMKKKAAVPKAIADASNAKSTVSSSEAELLTVDSNGWHFDLALLLLEATLCFWVIRIGVRMLLSHIHLENDAAERVTMAQTYIALLRRGRLPEADDLKTVLAALFRPSGDGIVKDEGIPPSMMDLLIKLKT